MDVDGSVEVAIDRWTDTTTGKTIVPGQPILKSDSIDSGELMARIEPVCESCHGNGGDYIDRCTAPGCPGKVVQAGVR